MLARSFRSRGAVAVATLAMAACASTTSTLPRQHAPVSRVPSLTPTSRVLDAERIRRSGAQTAWDAVRLLVPAYRFGEARGPSLRTYSPLDPRSFESSIRLVIDGHQLRGLDALRSIPARDVIVIHVLNGIEASTYFGPGSGGGAIVVETRSTLRPR